MQIELHPGMPRGPLRSNDGIRPAMRRSVRRRDCATDHPDVVTK
jgi:hypothetical protein